MLGVSTLVGAIDWDLAGTVVVVVIVGGSVISWLYQAVIGTRLAREASSPGVSIDPATVSGGTLGRREVAPSKLTGLPDRHKLWAGYVVGNIDRRLRGVNYLAQASMPTATIEHTPDPANRRAAAELLQRAIDRGESGAIDPKVVDVLRQDRKNKLARKLVKSADRQARARRN